MSARPCVFLIDCKDQTSSWESMNLILPAIRRAWTSTAELHGGVVRTFEADRKSIVRFLGQILAGATQADLIVFSLVNQEAAELILMLRKELECQTPFAIHLYGEA